MDCNKLKKKAIIGMFLYSYFLIGRIIDFSYYIGSSQDIALAIFIGILGMYLMLPYVTCLSEKNKRGKPPFS